MQCLKLTITYDGTGYAGWQAQVESVAATAGKPTIQQTLERAICEFCGESVRLMASGRTDAGVHALGQVVSLRTTSERAAGYPLGVWVKALNARLPNDIRVLHAEPASDDFHPTHDARRKRYRYTIDNGPVLNIFQQRTHWFVAQRLDLAAMRQAAQYLVGTHDFSSFESTGAPRSTSIRTILDLTVTACPAVMEYKRIANIEQESISTVRYHSAISEIQIEIEADGFLYHMVRAIAGTLVEVGKGRWTPERMVEILAARTRSVAGPNAPAHGLCLLHVTYPDRSPETPR